MSDMTASRIYFDRSTGSIKKGVPPKTTEAATGYSENSKMYQSLKAFITPLSNTLVELRHTMNYQGKQLRDMQRATQAALKRNTEATEDTKEALKDNAEEAVKAAKKQSLTSKALNNDDFRKTLYLMLGPAGPIMSALDEVVADPLKRKLEAIREGQDKANAASDKKADIDRQAQTRLNRALGWLGSVFTKGTQATSSWLQKLLAKGDQGFVSKMLGNFLPGYGGGKGGKGGKGGTIATGGINPKAPGGKPTLAGKLGTGLGKVGGIGMSLAGLAGRGIMGAGKLLLRAVPFVGWALMIWDVGSFLWDMLGSEKAKALTDGAVKGIKALGSWINDSILKPIVAFFDSETWTNIKAGYRVVKGVLGELGGWVLDTIIKPIGGALKDNFDELKAKVTGAYKIMETATVFLYDKIFKPIGSFISEKFGWLYTMAEKLGIVSKPDPNAKPGVVGSLINNVKERFATAKADIKKEDAAAPSVVLEGLRNVTKALPSQSSNATVQTQMQPGGGRFGGGGSSGTWAGTTGVAGGAGAAMAAGWNLGDTSKKYESGRGGAGTVSTGVGDSGGVSYGTYQMSSTRGTAQKFVDSSPYAGDFKGLKAGTPEFSSKWKEIAARDSNFGKAQHDYIKATHYDIMADKLKKSGIDVSSAGPATQDAVWSSAVHYGPHSNVIAKAFEGKDFNKMSDKERIQTIQDYKAKTVGSYFGKNSANVQQSIARRVENERADLEKLAANGTVTQPEIQAKRQELPNNQITVAQPAATTPPRHIGPTSNSPSQTGNADIPTWSDDTGLSIINTSMLG